MTTRRFLRILLAWFGSFSLGALAAERPDVLFVLVDDLGYGDVGVFFQKERAAAGDGPAHFTPALDRMAAAGMQLRHHYTAAPVCAPARASLLTGQHQGNAPVRNNQFDRALADQWNLPKVLQEAGYRTALVGKYGLQGRGKSAETWPAYPTRRGFDDFFGYVRHRDGHEHYPYEHPHFPKRKKPVEVWWDDREVGGMMKGCYTADLWTAWTKDWLVRHSKESRQQPFFLMLCYDTPHATTQLPAGPYPKGGGLDGGLQWLGKAGGMINTADGEIDSYVHPDYADKDWKMIYKRYASSVRRIDQGVGDLLQTLDDLEMLENTLVVFTSDNGPSHESYLKQRLNPSFFESFGPLDGTKRDCWEGGIRVGALAHWPAGIRPGGVTQLPSQFHDWLPTFCELAGAPVPALCDGDSLVPVLKSASEAAAHPVYVEYAVGGRTPKYQPFAADKAGRKRGEMQVMIDWPYKAVRYDITKPDTPFEVYDLVKDPSESTNLAGREGIPTQAYWVARCQAQRGPMANAKRPYDDWQLPGQKPGGELKPGLLMRMTEAGAPYVSRITGGKRQVSALDLPTAKGMAEFAGWIKIENDGSYEFSVDEGLKAVVRINGALSLDTDSPEGRSIALPLGAGYHRVTINVRLDGKARSGFLKWQAGSSGFAPVPQSQLMH